MTASRLQPEVLVTAEHFNVIQGELITFHVERPDGAPVRRQVRLSELRHELAVPNNDLA